MPTNPSQATYSFEVKTEGDRHTILYQKTKYGIKMYFPLLWISLLISAFIAVGLSLGVAGYIFLSLFLPVITIVVMNYFRKPDSFSLTKTGIEHHGNLYDYAHINGMYTKTPAGKQHQMMEYRSGGFVMVSGDRVGRIGAGATAGVATATHAVGNAGLMISNAAGNAMRRNFKAKNTRIYILYGEKEISIARGLTEKGASVLLQKVDELM